MTFALTIFNELKYLGTIFINMTYSVKYYITRFWVLSDVENVKSKELKHHRDTKAKTQLREHRQFLAIICVSQAYQTCST